MGFFFRYRLQHTVVQVELLSKGSINPQLCKVTAPPNKLYISWYYFKLAGHPRSGCPARLRGHKGSGLWKVWTVPSPPLPSPPLPSPPLPSPPLPSPTLPSLPSAPLPSPPLPSPALPSPPLPSLPSLPPSLPRAKFDQAGSSRLAKITARRSARV